MELERLRTIADIILLGLYCQWIELQSGMLSRKPHHSTPGNFNSPGRLQPSIILVT